VQAKLNAVAAATQQERQKSQAALNQALLPLQQKLTATQQTLQPLAQRHNQLYQQLSVAQNSETNAQSTKNNIAALETRGPSVAANHVWGMNRFHGGGVIITLPK
jgi:uncharacterized protein YlxW (UPF0749 family)